MFLLCPVRNLTLPSRQHIQAARYITVLVLCAVHCPLFLNPAPNSPLCRKALHFGVSSLEASEWKTPQVGVVCCCRHRRLRNVACGSCISAPRASASTSDTYILYLLAVGCKTAPNSELRTPNPNTNTSSDVRPLHTFFLFQAVSRCRTLQHSVQFP